MGVRDPLAVASGLRAFVDKDNAAFPEAVCIVDWEGSWFADAPDIIIKQRKVKEVASFIVLPFVEDRPDLD